ncbi:hypothetical protein BGW36DRAFT_411752 [Talaromyces proteolyticus]|uniref:BHLH domain-containing protein n=1 Tax=Talaromyces proteolyticus TaxID=1131652 RepID=A0AAD4KJL2_9EURO|nr:uncharacterized protein BGW36DRAFT_411752 [Talaromyces proteolyticus]KAH8689824.1 hypothetical protein BGW36DRAFT_411752 [Talaromyces proteolyticus]
MACFQPTPGLLNSTRPMMIPSSAVFEDDIDTENVLMPDLPPTLPFSTADWIGNDNAPFAPLSADYNGREFALRGRASDDLEFLRMYSLNDNSSPVYPKACNIDIDDTLQDVLPVSPKDGKSELQSLVQKKDDQFPPNTTTTSIVDMEASVPLRLASHRNTRMRTVTTTVTKAREVPRVSATAAAILSEKTIESSPRPRKCSDSTSSSSSFSSSSSLSKPCATSLGRSSTTLDTNVDVAVKRKRFAHNVIEKRYRTNLNTKFIVLGNSIPQSEAFATQLASNTRSRKFSLCQSQHSAAANTSVGKGAQQQLQSRSEILTNALSYINSLRGENSRLKGELFFLKNEISPNG